MLGQRWSSGEGTGDVLLCLKGCMWLSEIDRRRKKRLHVEQLWRCQGTVAGFHPEAPFDDSKPSVKPEDEDGDGGNKGLE